MKMTLFKKVKLLLALSAVLAMVLLFGCSPYSSEDEKVMEKLGFDELVYQKLKERSSSDFYPYLDLIDSSQTLCMADTFPIIRDMVFDLKEEFSKLGYLIFVSDEDLEQGIDELMVIPNTELGELEIVRFMKPSPYIDSVYRQGVFNQIAQWNDDYGVLVIGANRNWVEIQFQDIPTDPMKVIMEAYEICPAVIGPKSQGVGALKQQIMNGEDIYLWWETAVVGWSN